MATKPKTTVAPSVATGYNSAQSYYATQYRQGGRTVYSLDLSIEQLTGLIPKPDPERLTPGNRQIRKKHAEEFGSYIREHDSWVSPGIILRSPAVFEFQPQVEVEGAQFGLLTFPVRSATEIHILDGQHRIYGFHDALANIALDIDKARDALATARRVDPKSKAVSDAQKKVDALINQRDRLSEERVSIQIVVEVDSQKYKQIFADIADNSLGITASVKSMFDSRKVVNRSLQYVFEHPLLVGRVDTEVARTTGKNPNFLSAASVGELVKSVTVGLDGRVGKNMEATLNERGIATKALEFFDIITAAFPALEAMKLGQILPRQLRETSLLGSTLILRILAGAYYDLVIQRDWTAEDLTEFFAKLSPHMTAPVHEDSIWIQHTDEFDEEARAPHSRRQDVARLKDRVVEWALLKPEWLELPPAPRPVSSEEEMRKVDEILAK